MYRDDKRNATSVPTVAHCTMACACWARAMWKAAGNAPRAGGGGGQGRKRRSGERGSVALCRPALLNESTGTTKADGNAFGTVGRLGSGENDDCGKKLVPCGAVPTLPSVGLSMSEQRVREERARSLQTL
ncbi:hypothetical protein EYF80_011797 [Liparis tanakae]|uniref:Uncharacterized protein n=1 Tax=Liparis tanakae TaxID=230148 RepID=A0A4Z2ILJ6_9TELE|nr:hypothetical protein EYF80_011797 [Liparis tanakae]